MKNFHIKSIILGVGIGMVLTAIISIIFLAGIDMSKTLSKDQVIKLAKEYGMVESGSTGQKQSVFKETEVKSADSSKENTGEKAASDLKVPDSTDKAKAGPVKEVQEIEFGINQGDSSQVVTERLLNLGLISDKEAFGKRLSDLGMATRIKVGKFSLKKGMNTDEIIKIICNQ